MQLWPWLLTAIAALSLLGVVLRAFSPAEKSVAVPRGRAPSNEKVPGSAPAKQAGSLRASAPPKATPSSAGLGAPSLRVAEAGEDLDFTVVRAAPLISEHKEEARRSSPGEQVPSLAPPAHDGDPSSEPRPSRVEILYEDNEAAVDEATSVITRLEFKAYGDTDIGRRRDRNEDQLLVLPQHSLFVVADGMGGHRGGEVASTLAVETIQQAFDDDDFRAELSSDKPLPRRAHELACALQMANDVIVEHARSDPRLANMGTTTVAARFSAKKERVYIGHVGDSRCYRLRGGALRQLTSDHTLGALGAKGPKANELVRAVGIGKELEIDLIVDKPRPGDLYLLCSDGLTKMVPEEEIRATLMRDDDLDALVYTLIEQANDRGGKDNVTVIVVKISARA
jgi:serine/threonine protein phosphatase PrpC